MKIVISLFLSHLLFIFSAQAGLINGLSTDSSTGSSLNSSATDPAVVPTVLPDGSSVSTSTNCGTTDKPVNCKTTTTLTPKTPAATAPPAGSGSGGGGSPPPGGGGGGGGGSGKDKDKKDQNSKDDSNSGSSSKSKNRDTSSSDSTEKKSTREPKADQPSPNSEYGCPVSGEYQAKDASSGEAQGISAVGKNVRVNAIEGGEVLLVKEGGPGGHQVLIKTKKHGCLLYENLSASSAQKGQQITAGLKIGSLGGENSGTSTGEMKVSVYPKCPDNPKDLENLGERKPAGEVYPQIKDNKTNCDFNTGENNQKPTLMKATSKGSSK